MISLKDERVKQVTIGVSFLMALTVVVAGSLIGWPHLPGMLGEWVGMITGIMTTPFFMEGSFILLGLVTVVSLNTWRRHKDGDEFVYLEQVTGPDVPANLPDQAKWAVYRDKPLNPEQPSAMILAQGAFATGDMQTATDWLATMSHDELSQPEGMELRLRLARATGKPDLAEELEARIKSMADPAMRS